MRYALLVLLALTTPAFAQTAVLPHFRDTDLSAPEISPTAPFPMTGNTNIPTYSGGAQIANTGAGDILCIRGSATKTVRVKAVRISAIASAAIAVDVLLYRRSSAASGGTAVAAALTPSDSLNAAATATLTTYTVSPTPGTTVGVVRAAKLAVGTTGNSNTIGDEIFHFTGYWDQPQVLRGTSQFLCVNVSALGTGASINVGTELTEQ
jgi:hypothetical protein